jgi:hypothetical protein
MRTHSLAFLAPGLVAGMLSGPGYSIPESQSLGLRNAGTIIEGLRAFVMIAASIEQTAIVFVFYSIAPPNENILEPLAFFRRVTCVPLAVAPSENAGHGPM